MDQTKFINSYIANLAERLKALTLDNIMLSTQLTMANETNVGLTQRIEILEHEANQPKPNGNYVGLEGNLEFGTSEEYSIAENEDVDDSSSNNSTNKKK
jgi:hypothetical protein